MSHEPLEPKPETPPAPNESALGLRLRLWLACIAGGAIAGLGSLWVLGTRLHPGATDPAELLAWLAGVALTATFVGLLLALWIDHHIVGHLRGLLRGLNSRRVTELRDLPSAIGWGELSELTDVAREVLAEQRRTAHAAEDLEIVRLQLDALQAAIDRWLQSEVWTAPGVDEGPLAPAADGLARGFARRATVDEQNSQVARQVAVELSTALADAQESAEQAERGFVEATALLTTVRELQRLAGELQTALGALGTAPPAAGSDPRAALEELVAASQSSIDAIGRGMLRVQDVSELVHQLANRATLVAIHAVTASRRDEGAPAQDLADELRQLVADVREATERAGQFALDIEGAVAEASERMRTARERTLAQLEAPQAAATPAPVAGTRAWDDAQRLLERVREMVQDAARKGERLSAAGERASRAAERLARRVGDESAEAQALVVRLGPVASPAESTSHELRLLDRRSDAPSAPPAPQADEPPADEPREEDLP